MAACGRAQPPRPTPPYPVRAPESQLAQLEAALHTRLSQVEAGEVAVAFIDVETGRRTGINQNVPMRGEATAEQMARALESTARCQATGQRSCASSSSENDTGAIVHPPYQWPYVLVILTRGFGNESQSDRLRSELSQIVWAAVSNPQWISRPSNDARAQELFALYRRVRNPVIGERQFTQEQLHRALEPYHGRTITREQVGASAQGRPLHLYRFGSGEKRVLFWSQMHGNESTASMALTDLMKYIAETPQDARVQRWSREITLLMLPMLNPDGAARFQRQNAYGIDVNRDARALVTPEGQTLKAVHDRYKPHYGFNLHDQNPRTRVGNTSRLAAIALLAPVKNAEKTDDEQMLRAKRLAATVRNAVEPFVGGHVARYDDTFNPRAFGDLIQTWGTEAVLIESGAWHDDPEKLYIRAANFAALVTVLDAIADQSYLQTPIEVYTSLPPNGRSMVKLLITGGTIVPPQGPPYRAEITADVEAAIGALGAEVMRITEVGDIVGVETRDTIDVRGLFLHPSPNVLVPGPQSGHYITIGMVPSFTVRRGPDANSEIVGVIENGRYSRARRIR